MKRKALSLILCLLLLTGLILPASAASGLPAVVDDAGLLSDSQRADLESKAANVGSTYEMDVVIVTVDSLNGKSARAYADDYFDYNGYGEDGVLFLLAMEEREWYISTCGDAINALSDSDIQELGDKAVRYLSDGDYYEGFDAYLDALSSYLAGTPAWQSFLISLIIGIAAAAVVILIMRAAMNTKQPQRSAAVYLKNGSFHLHTHRDMFLYSRVNKVRRQENNSSGSSTHRSSSGRSHGGGGGKF